MAVPICKLSFTSCLPKKKRPPEFSNIFALMACLLRVHPKKTFSSVSFPKLTYPTTYVVILIQSDIEITPSSTSRKVRNPSHTFVTNY